MGAVGSNTGCSAAVMPGAAVETSASAGPSGAAATTASRSAACACSTAALRPSSTAPAAAGSIVVRRSAVPQREPGSSIASATASSPSASRAKAFGAETPSGAIAKRTAALARYGTGARCSPSARAIRHSSTAPSPSSPPTVSAPKSARLRHSALRPAAVSASALHARPSSVAIASLSQPCSSLSSRSMTSLLGEAEHAAGDDVALDLLRTAVDGRGARVEVGLVPEVVLGAIVRLPVLERRAEDLERGRREALLGLGHEQLHARAVRADGAAVEELPDGPVRVMPQHLDADQRSGERDLRLRIVDQRLAAERPLGAHAHRTVEPRAQLDLTRERGGPAFVSERVHGDLPSVAASAEQVLLRHHDVVQEQLAELGVAGDLRHRPHFEARRAHLHDQHRDPAVPGRVRVRAGEHAAPARELPPGDPRLLAAHDEVVVVLDRARSQRREVGARVGLREALAPDRVRREDRRDVAAPLLVGAEAQQRGAEHVEPHDVDELGRAGGRELRAAPDLRRGGPPAAAELGRPRAAHVAGLVAARLPRPQRLDALLERSRQAPRIGRLGGEERPDLLLEPALGVARGKSHEWHTTKLISLQVGWCLRRLDRCLRSTRLRLHRAATTTMHETHRGEESTMSTLRFQPEAARFYTEGHWRAGDLWGDFAARAAATPDKAALILDDRAVTYGELRRGAVALSARLAAGGVRAGDVVVLLGRHSIEAAVAFLGALHRGAVLAPLPPMFNATQLSALSRQTRAKAIVSFGGDREIATCERVAGEVDAFVPIRPETLDELVREDAPDERTARGADDVAVLIHSSGTTSEPKGIVHSSNTLRYATEGLCRRWGLSGDDTFLVVSEFGFVGGLVFGYLPVLLTGGTGVLMSRWNPDEALRLVEERRCTYVLLMPTHGADALRAAEATDRDLSSMRVLAAPGLTPERRLAMREAFGVPPLADYGLSEVPGHTAHGLHEPEPKLVATEGRPYDGTEIRILGPDDVVLGPGEIGAVVVNGPSRFLGFLGNDELTRASLTSWGGYRTGDLGYLDEDGHLIYVGRSKDVIRRGGVTVVPAEVEPVLLRHPAIHEAAIVPPPDDRLGERACAALILEPGAPAPTLAQLQAFLETEGVAKYTWPESVEIFADFPRTPSMKVVKREVVKRILDRSVPAGATAS